MRTSELILGAAVVGCLLLIFLRDGPDDAQVRALRGRVDALEETLAGTNARLDELLEAKREPEPRLLGTPRASQAALEALAERVAAGEDWRKNGERLLRALTAGLEELKPEGKQAGRKGQSAAQTVMRWISRLDDEDEDIVFSATIELARLRAKEAVPHLIRVLRNHADFYARLGAATALGELTAADAVPSLIGALDDKDDLVRTAASEALHRITKQDFKFVSGLKQEDRVAIQRKWFDWWRDNETAVREQLARPK
jgi:hypothetical protein